ncbi:MAG: glycosyl hydrolase, partial [Chloroflexota bacterium]
MARIVWHTARLGLALVVLLGVALTLSPTTSQALAPLFADHYRFGVDVWGFPGTYNLSVLGVGWYTNWQFLENPPRPNGIEYYQVVRLRAYDGNPDHAYYWPPDWASLARAVQNNPGAVWMVGNEPDHSGQDNCTPTQFAERYRLVYTFIKQRDATARLIPAGIVQATPLRLQWLSAVLTEYQRLYGEPLPA